MGNSYGKTSKAGVLIEKRVEELGLKSQMNFPKVTSFGRGGKMFQSGMTRVGAEKVKEPGFVDSIPDAVAAVMNEEKCLNLHPENIPELKQVPGYNLTKFKQWMLTEKTRKKS